MEWLLDARPRGQDIDHHRLVWDFHVEHRWTGVIRVLHERMCISDALFWNRGGILDARVEAEDRRCAGPDGVHEFGRGRCALALART